MGFLHGSKAALRLPNTGGTLTDVSSYLRKIIFRPRLDAVDTTTMGAVARSLLGGLREGTLYLEGLFDPTLDAILDNALNVAAAGSASTFEYFPQGTAVGKPKYSGAALCVHYDVPMDVNDIGLFSAEFRLSGPLTRGTA